MVPGLSLMYDAAIETLRSTDLPIESDIINARAIRAVERSFDRVLPLIGSTTVTALELALDDEGLADRLRQRAYELGTSYLVPLPPGVCEHCTFEVYEDGELVRSGCGTKEECDAMLIIVIVLVVIWLLKELWDWLT